MLVLAATLRINRPYAAQRFNSFTAIQRDRSKKGKEGKMGSND